EAAQSAEQILGARAQESSKLGIDWPIRTRTVRTAMKTISAFLMAFGILSAQAPQAPNPTQQSSAAENAARLAAGSLPIYRVTVVERTTEAVNYRNRGGATKIDFRGTPLLPKAHGEAKVESKQGYIE